MFRLITKKIGYWKNRHINDSPQAVQPSSPDSLFLNLDHNLVILKDQLGTSSDIVIRKVKLGFDNRVAAALIYIDGLVDKNVINRDILKSLMISQPLFLDHAAEPVPRTAAEIIQEHILPVGNFDKVTNFTEVVNSVLSGKAVLLVDEAMYAFAIDIREWKTRSVEEANVEVTIHGPKESFTETLRTNTALIRRRIRDSRLIIESLTIGDRSKTDVALIFIKGIATDDLIQEIRERLARIDTDIILDTGYIEQFIEDEPFSLFSTINNTERPDVAAARILEGRAAILVDGSPFALTAPMVFIEAFQNPEDYYMRPYFASFLRITRMIAFLISIHLPAVYVALLSYHQELIPTPLLITVAASKEGTPFPVVIEALLMIFLFEILREAGLRMPRNLGQAVSIVGALVIGQAAVAAGVVGAPMVIVVATTAIASFLVPNHADVGALLRLLFTIAAGFLGLLAVTLLSIEILSRLCALRSFGVPYLSPVTPVNTQGWKDVFWRAPLWSMEKRPQNLGSSNRRRQAPGQLPHKPANQ